MTSEESIIEQKTFDRTLEWNNAGYDGSGITVWNLEPLNEHGRGTRKRLLDAAPGVNVINEGHGFRCVNNEPLDDYVEHNGEKLKTDDFIEKYDVSVCSHSHGSRVGESPCRKKLYGNLKNKYNLTYFNSAGNDGSEGVKGGAFSREQAIYVGVCMAYKGNFNDLRMWNYSSWGDEFE